MQFHEFGTSALALGLALGAVDSAHARQAATPVKIDQPTVAPPAAPIQSIEIRGNADAYDARRDDTAARIVISRDDLLKYGDASVVESLKRVSGVTVVSTGRGNEIRMRGLGSGYTQILVNGDRTPLGFSLDSIAPAQIERIEVYRSATAELSTESIAGTINVVLRKTVKKAQREIQLGYGGDKTDKTPRGNFQMANRDGNFSWSVSGTSRNTRFDRQSPLTEEVRNNAAERVSYQLTEANDVGSLDVFNIVPRLNWTLANGDTVSSQNFVSLNRFKFRSAQTTTSPLADDLPRYGSMDWRIGTENRLAKSDLLWSHKMASGGKLDVKVGVQFADADRAVDRLGFAPVTGEQNLVSNAASRARDKNYNSTGKYLAPAGDGHTVVFGWDLSSAERSQDGWQRDNTFGGPGAVNFDQTFDSTITRFAAFGQDEWNISPAWSVYLGLRWQGIRTRTDGSGFLNSRTSDSILSPIFQALYKLPQSKGDQVRFALTRTYKAPDIGDLIPLVRTQEINSPTNPDTAGNPLLKPELALGFDIGYEHYWDKNAYVSMTLASRQIDDYTLVEVKEGANGRAIAVPRNSGKASSQSLELEAKFPLQTVMTAAPPVDIRASVSRNWSDVKAVPGPENRILQQTPLSATLSVDYAAGPLTTGGSFMFNSAGWSRQSFTQRNYGSVRRDLDVYGVWKFTPMHQLRLSLGNLLRQDTVAATSYEGADGSTTRTTFVRGYVNIRALFEMKL